MSPTGRSRARHRQTTGGQGIARECDSPKPIHAQGENAQAVDLHQQAVALFDALGDTSEVARTLSGSIQPLLLMGEYNRAFAAAERARKIFAEEGNTWRLARLDINLGNIYYRQDRFAE